MKPDQTNEPLTAWIGGKNSTLEELNHLREQWKSDGRIVVTTNGCFDLIHPGHIRFLQAARNEGDLLVVGLNSDRSVRTLKGEGKPLLNQQERAHMLSALKAVDAVLVFDDLLPNGFLEFIRPDVHCKAADYDAESLPEGEVVKKYGGKISILPLIEGFSSTNLTERILRAHETSPGRGVEDGDPGADRAHAGSERGEQAGSNATDTPGSDTADPAGSKTTGQPGSGDAARDSSNRDDEILTYLLASSNVFRQTAYKLKPAIEEAAALFTETLKAGHKILFCGNGGSASDSQHIAAELVGRFKKERKALPAIALTTDTSILTAVANDYGFEHIFSRQVAALGNPGDLLVAISTSGNSKNILKAVEQAQASGLKVIGLTGETESAIGAASDLAIRVPSTDTALIQQVHIGVMHLFCDIAEKKLFE